MPVMNAVERPDNMRCFGFVPTGIVGDSEASIYIDLAVSSEMGVPRSPTKVLVQLEGSPLAHPTEMYLSMGVQGAQISNTLAFLLGIEDGQPVPKLEIILLEQ